jgi:hypothetical protein
VQAVAAADPQFRKAIGAQMRIVEGDDQGKRQGCGALTGGAWRQVQLPEGALAHAGVLPA